MVSRLILLKMGNVSDQVVEKTNTHFLCNVLYRISPRLSNNIEIYCTAIQATNDNIAHAICMLDTEGCSKRSDYVIVFAFPRQKWSWECGWMLRLCVNCLFCLLFWKVFQCEIALSLGLFVKWPNTRYETLELGNFDGHCPTICRCNESYVVIDC